MKRTTKKLTKMQRKARSRRKTWTNAERFMFRHAREMKEQAAMLRALKKLKEQFAQQSSVEGGTIETPTEPADGELLVEENQD